MEEERGRRKNGIWIEKKRDKREERRYRFNG